MKALRAAIASAGVVIALASCGGRGGEWHSVSSNALPPQSRSAPVGSATGRVVDAVSGLGIAGATVVISPEAYTGATPPPMKADAPRATTDSRGDFTVRNLQKGSLSEWSWKYIDESLPNVPYPQWVEVFANDGQKHAVYHGFRTIRWKRSNALGTIILLVPTPIELAWARGVAHGRRYVGTPPSTQRLVIDNIALAAGRRWAAYMAANDWFAHVCPPPNSGYAPCQLTWLWEIAQHGIPSAENVAQGFADWRSAEAAFMAERENCPAGGDWKTCPYSETTGHYINIMAATTWIGLGTATASSGIQFWDEEFTGPAPPMTPQSEYLTTLREHPDWR